MFVYSVRASGVKFFAIILAALAVLIGVLISGDSVYAASVAVGDVDFSGIKTEEDRIAFIESFGIKVDKSSGTSIDFLMPENFDRIMIGYNEIQKTQGLDISRYAKKKVTRYTYEAVDYGDYDGAVFVNLLVYRSTIIGCDVSSGDPEGFVKPLFG